MKRLLIVLSFLVLPACKPQPVAPSQTNSPENPPTRTSSIVNRTGDFDFYVLALSWSPDYCSKKGAQDPQQCSIGKRLGFVLHGLWPQFDKGYPANCSNERLPASLKERYAGLYPSEKLFDHEWSKHGTCSSLKPEGYLALSKQLKESVRIPSAYQQPSQPFRTTISELQSAFKQANTSYPENSVLPNCSGGGRFLQEVFVCFTKEGRPKACSNENVSRSRRTCGQKDFLVRSVR